MPKARLIVKGNVQGVGFRVWVKLFARKLGIKGLARSLEDGTVECFLDGSKPVIEEFMKRVGVKGVPDDPLSLHVDEMEVYWEGEREYKPAWREYEAFEIDYGAEELRTAEKEMLESLEWSKLHFAGMNRVFKDEFAGTKRVFKDEFAGMKRVFREEFRGLRGEFKGVRGEVGEMRSDMKEMHGDLKGEAAGIRGELKEMRVEVNKSFEEMAKRYDVISSELIRTREELTRAVSTLVELVKKFVKER